MKKKNFSILALLGTLLLGGLFSYCMTPGPKVAAGIESFFWAGAFFAGLFIAGSAGLYLALRFHFKYVVHRSAQWIRTAALSAVLLFIIGFVGQILFSFQWVKGQESVGEVDMVLLLDASGSMDGYGFSGPRTEAASQFVEGLPASSRLQAVAFSSNIAGKTGLEWMNDTGKNNVVSFIQAVDSLGLTNYDLALSTAMETLQQNYDPDRSRAVILLSDGEMSDGQSTLDDAVRQAYLDSDVQLYTMRLAPYGSTADGGQFADLAIATGGQDTVLTPDAGGHLDASKMLDAFLAAYHKIADDELSWSKDLLVYADGISLLQFLIRAVVMVLSAVLFDLGYFGSLNKKGLAQDAILGLFLAVALTVIDGQNPSMSVLCAAIVLCPAFVNFDLGEGGDTFDV